MTHEEKKILRSKLYKADERADCVLIQGGAFVIDGRAYIILGMGVIDILEPLSQFKDIHGIIGTGNALFISKDFKIVYSALSKKETLKRYEIDKTEHEFKYLEQAKVAPLIFLNRVVKSEQALDKIRTKKKDQITFDLTSHFFTEPIRFAGSIKARLNSKFIKTAQSVHCPTHPPITKKEFVFDSTEIIRKLIGNFKGHFLLGYALWSEKFAHSMSMEINYSTDLKDNPSEIIGFTMLKLAQQFSKKINKSTPINLNCI